MSKPSLFTPQETKGILSLGTIMFSHMLGLFLILPVFSLLAKESLTNASNATVGLAMGAYGLTAACLQVPLGVWSDKVGRKPVLAFALLLFVSGSLLAAMADSIELMILARLIQGAGAVSAPLFALIADLTRPEVRARANAGLGGAVGLSFGISMSLSPLLAGWVGLHGIFWIISALACVSMLLLFTVVPSPLERATTKEPVLQLLKLTLANRELRIINLGAFASKMGLSAVFFMLPFTLRGLGLDKADWWKIYLPLLLVGGVAMVPAAIMAEAKNKFKQVMATGIATMLVAFGLLAWFWGEAHLVARLVAIFLFFMAFNVFEPLFPSLVTRLSTAESKGTASGVYNLSQFLGLALGSILAGLLYAQTLPYLAGALALVALAFGFALRGFANPPPRQAHAATAPVSDLEEQTAEAAAEQV